MTHPITRYIERLRHLECVSRIQTESVTVEQVTVHLASQPSPAEQAAIEAAALLLTAQAGHRVRYEIRILLPTSPTP